MKNTKRHNVLPSFKVRNSNALSANFFNIGTADRLCFKERNWWSDIKELSQWFNQHSRKDKCDQNLCKLDHTLDVRYWSTWCELYDMNYRAIIWSEVQHHKGYKGNNIWLLRCWLCSRYDQYHIRSAIHWESVNIVCSVIQLVFEDPRRIKSKIGGHIGSRSWGSTRADLKTT